MGIYRGAGGTGDAVADSSSEALLVRNLAIEVQADADAAAASAAAAAASASTASTAASNAQTAETNAETAEANAETAQAAAESARDAAQTAQTAAETAQSAAATSATNAASSASAASTSASNAASSASTASTQATNASNSASAAATSATNASNSASAAATSATNAASSATSASGSATAATTQATNASNSATAAASSATNAAASATTAATQAGLASTSATNASNSASAASTSASNAATSATNASNSASAASTSATNASNSATAAASSATSAAASYDSFDDRYLGPKASAPTVDNDGNTLLVGALYFNTVDNAMKVWSGTIWLNSYASLSGALLATNNLSDLTSASTARTNLGLGTAATTNSTAYATAAQGTKADNALTAANPSYTGTFTGDTGVVNIGSGQFYKDTSGNVGIGVTPSGWASSWKVIENQGGFFGSNSTASQLVSNNCYSNGTNWIYKNTAAATQYTQISGEHIWYGAASGTAGNAITFNERMRIDSSGNFMVGTTSAGGAGGVTLYKNGSGTSGLIIIAKTADGNVNSAIGFYAGASLVGTINYNNTSTSYVTSSDYRLKENIAPMTGALDVVQALKPVTYNWKADGSDGQGFIAHELQAVVPDCVTGEKDAIDEEGKPVYQGIDTSFLIATLTAAIQELKAELDATKAQLDESNLILTSVKTEVAALKAGA